MRDFIIEFWGFLRQRRKLWLVPILAVMILFGGLLAIAKGSVLAPFLYTLF